MNILRARRPLLTAMISLLLLAAGKTAAQSRFRTAELQRLAAAIPLSPVLPSDGNHQVEQNGLRLSLTVNQQTISHIGIQLFADEVRTKGNACITRFLERYFLSLKFPPDGKSAAKLMREDDFRILCGTFECIDELRPTDDFGYTFANRRYTATWSRGRKTLLSVAFPARYELLSGENKIEAEENLPADVQAAIVDTLQADELRNDSYLSPDLTNRLYLKDSALIADRQYPIESAANMMLSQRLADPYMLNVTHLRYGNQKVQIELPLRQWIAYCRNNGCKLYFGVKDTDRLGTINATLLAVNEPLGYHHLLTVSIPVDAIGQQQGVLTATLHSFIPIHNVRSLFGTNPKRTSQKHISQ